MDQPNQQNLQFEETGDTDRGGKKRLCADVDPEIFKQLNELVPWGLRSKLIEAMCQALLDAIPNKASSYVIIASIINGGLNITRGVFGGSIIELKKESEGPTS